MPNGGTKSQGLGHRFTPPRASVHGIPKERFDLFLQEQKPKLKKCKKKNIKNKQKTAIFPSS